MAFISVKANNNNITMLFMGLESVSKLSRHHYKGNSVCITMYLGDVFRRYIMFF